MKLTLDATVFLSRFRDTDVKHAEAVTFLERCELLGVRLFAPVLLLAEVAGAISRVRRAARLGEVAITRIFAQPGLLLRPVGERFAEKAARLAARHALRGADAVYLTVAEETKSILITSHRELLQTESRVIVQTPEAWLASNR